MGTRFRLGAFLRTTPLVVLMVSLWETSAFCGACGGRWPHLHDVAIALVRFSPELAWRTALTGLSVASSLILGAVAGGALAVYLSSSRFRIPGLYTVIAALRPVPVTILIPVFLSIFGLSRFVIPLIALPIATNLSVTLTQAAAACSARRKTLLLSWGVSDRAYLQHVLRFELLDTMFATARILIPLCFALNIALDYFLYTTDGIGAFVSAAYDRREFSRMLAGTLVVALVGVILAWTVDVTSRRSLKWKRDT
jgi:NitT/TauT family transport system permease protein